MGVTMSTIVQWTVIFAVIGAYFYITNIKKGTTPLSQKLAGAIKSKDSTGFLDDASGAEKKKKSSKKDKKQQKTGSIIPKVTLEPETSEYIPERPSLEEDKGSLQRLAGLKSGQAKSSKPEARSEKKKAEKTKSGPAPATLAAAPVSPSLGAISSTSSTTGADGDIDEPDSIDDGNLVDDMLEKIPGANVLRITPSQDEFTTVSRKKGNQQSEKKEGLTSLQKKNQKKNEMKKELKKLEKEDQLRRLEAHKKDQRLAREAEAAKNPKKEPAPPSSSAWANSSKGASSTPATGLLDTFDSSTSTSRVTPSSSDVESGRYRGLALSEDQKQEIPKEVLAEYYAEQRELGMQEPEWVEVKPRRREKKKADTESETDSDARLYTNAPQAGKNTLAAAAAANSSQQSQPKPKRQFTDQDLKIPAMPAAESSEIWDAHAW